MTWLKITTERQRGPYAKENKRERVSSFNIYILQHDGRKIFSCRSDMNIDISDNIIFITIGTCPNDILDSFYIGSLVLLWTSIRHLSRGPLESGRVYWKVGLEGEIATLGPYKGWKVLINKKFRRHDLRMVQGAPSADVCGCCGSNSSGRGYSVLHSGCRGLRRE